MAETPFFFSQRLAELTKTHGQHIALIDRDTETTFAQLEQQAGQLAGNLHALRIQRAQRVAVWLPNCLAWVQTFLACAHLGATVLAASRESSRWAISKALPFARLPHEAARCTTTPN